MNEAEIFLVKLGFGIFIAILMGLIISIGSNDNNDTYIG